MFNPGDYIYHKSLNCELPNIFLVITTIPGYNGLDSVRVRSLLTNQIFAIQNPEHYCKLSLEQYPELLL